MSMRMALWHVPNETIDDLEKDPTLLSDVVYELTEYNEELPDEEKVHFDLDKAWCGLNYLLKSLPTKSELRLFLTDGGLKFGEVQEGYGGARAYRVKDVERLHDLLKEYDFENVRKSVTVKELVTNEIYPFTADEHPTSVFGFLKRYYEELSDFVRTAQRKKFGLLLYLY